MKITCIGGGPAGLYFSILMKKAYPEAEITIYERNKSDDTFGWGVVFSAETLGHFEDADKPTYDAITREFRYWDDIETYFGGECVRSTGHGFCGMSRMKMLQLMQERCLELGITINFESEITDIPAAKADCDLLIGCDGLNSLVREEYKEVFAPSLDWRTCRFAWLGTDLELSAFTFVYRENEHGLFQVHAYPFAEGLSTWIVETHEDTWRRAGLDKASEEETVAYCLELFKDDLKGHKLLTNRSIWRSFPTIKNEVWHHENAVIIGDSAHTAHFSIGSGTKLAMEDAIALVDAFKEKGVTDVPGALAHYQEERFVDVIKLQKAAQTSLEWFEHSERYQKQSPVQFSFNQLTRSKRITWDNLELRDPAFMQAVREDFANSVGAEKQSNGEFPVPIFTKYKIGEMELSNRLVVSPMCMYSCDDGTPTDWHFVHYGSRAIGGAGLIIAEMTDVTRDGRISPGCAGIYKDEHVAAWRRITDFVHENSDAKIALQLGHAGRKASTKLAWEGIDQPLDEGNWEVMSASPLRYKEFNQTPREMTRADMDELIEAYGLAAKRSDAAGFDMVELHMAHGYLLSCFISPLTNTREDEYGGDLAARMKFPLECLRAVREAWPAEKPISVRISATDWAEGGLTSDESVELAKALMANGADIIDVSAGQTVANAEPNYGRMFQVPFAERIKIEAGIPVMAVGAIQGEDHANTIIAAGRADLAVMARPHLEDPYLALHAAKKYGFVDMRWPPQYEAVK